MGRHTLHGNPPIEVTLRKSARARRLSLRVSRLDGRVTLTVPHSSPPREGIAFLEAKEDWLRRQLVRLAPVQRVDFGESILVQGVPRLIVPGSGRRVTLSADEISVPEGKPVAAQIKARLKVMARDSLAAASDRYAGVLGRGYARLSLRDTRSRWGSCSHNGTLMYSWRLIMAPPEVLDYVAAHEVAHLQEMNHAPAFWNVVARLCPGYTGPRQWLRENGDQLHRITFDD